MFGRAVAAKVKGGNLITVTVTQNSIPESPAGIVVVQSCPVGAVEVGAAILVFPGATGCNGEYTVLVSIRRNVGNDELRGICTTSVARFSGSFTGITGITGKAYYGRIHHTY